MFDLEQPLDHFLFVFAGLAGTHAGSQREAQRGKFVLELRDRGKLMADGLQQRIGVRVFAGRGDFGDAVEGFPTSGAAAGAGSGGRRSR
ncbi:MAG: hypothetical protein ACRESZ_07250 [Methylococcales bacterium]